MRNGISAPASVVSEKTVSVVQAYLPSVWKFMEGDNAAGLILVSIFAENFTFREVASFFPAEKDSRPARQYSSK